jgi:hypothetical protein
MREDVKDVKGVDKEDATGYKRWAQEREKAWLPNGGSQKSS